MNTFQGFGQSIKTSKIPLKTPLLLVFLCFLTKMSISHILCGNKQSVWYFCRW